MKIQIIFLFILLLINSGAVGQTAPLPYLFTYETKQIDIKSSDRDSLDKQVRITKTILENQSLNYRYVIVSSYDEIFSEELSKINYKRYRLVRKHLHKKGIRYKKIRYKEHYINLEPSLKYSPLKWKVSFVL